MTVILRNAILIIASIVVPATSARAAADPTGIVVVTGKPTARERTTIETAITRVLRRASWSMSSQPFSPKETESITKCLRDDRPWRCLDRLMQPKGVDRIVVATVTRPSATRLNITGELAVAGDGGAVVVERHCDDCENESLDAVVQKLAEDLLHDLAIRAETKLDLRTVPAGATVLLDGRSIGTTDASGKLSQSALPGPHKLRVQHPGFVDSERTIQLAVAQTTPVVVELVQAPSTGTPLLVPAIIAGAGVAALAGGILLQLGKDSPPVGEKQPPYIISYPGVALMAGGTIAIGIGVYLWMHAASNGAPTSTPTVAITAGGAVVGWAGHF